MESKSANGLRNSPQSLLSSQSLPYIGCSPVRFKPLHQRTNSTLEFYKQNVGPGSYDAPKCIFKKTPAYSFKPRNYLKNPQAGFGIIPGVGEYDINVPDEKFKKVKIGNGPKCPSSNFELPIISPGPIYGNFKTFDYSKQKLRKSLSVIFLNFI